MGVMNLQLGCFQFNAVQISALYEVNTIDLMKSGSCSLVILACSNTSLRIASAKLLIFRLGLRPRALSWVMLGYST